MSVKRIEPLHFDTLVPPENIDPDSQNRNAVELEKNRIRELFAEELDAVFKHTKLQAVEAGQAEVKKWLQAEKKKMEEICERELNNAKSHYKEARNKALDAAVALSKARNEALDAACKDMVLIVQRTVLKVLGKVYADGDLIAALIKTSLQYTHYAKSITVHVSPQEYADLTDAVQNDADLKKMQGLKLVSDIECGLGDCRLDLGDETIDVGLERQLKALSRLLRVSYKKAVRDV